MFNFFKKRTSHSNPTENSIPKGTESSPSKFEVLNEKFGVSKDCFDKEELQQVKLSLLEKYYTKPRTRAYVDYLAKHYDKSVGSVLLTTSDIKKKYGLSRRYIVENNLFSRLSDEALAACKEKEERKLEKVRNELCEIIGCSMDEILEYEKSMQDKFGVSLNTIKEGEYFKYSDEKISELLTKRKDNRARMISEILEDSGWSEYELQYDLLSARMNYGFSLTFYYHLRFWKVPESIRDSYGRTKDGNRLCSKYNTESISVLNNKLLFDAEYKDFLNRKYWINRDSSIDEFKDFIDGLDTVFCKPINLYGGHGAFKYSLNSSPEEMYEFFMNSPKMLIEEIPKQHHLINEIYDKSINTVRVFSVLKDDKFHAFAAWIKFGAKGSIVDGRVDGGNFAAVDEKTGRIITTALDGDNNRLECHPDSGVPFIGFQIPYWDQVLELTEKALRHRDGINYVGWDVAITENGPAIIEGNAHPAIQSYQLLFCDQQKGIRYKYEEFL